MSEVTILQAMDIAIQHHRAGRLAEAEGIYRQILNVQPDFPDALHLLGVLASQSRHPDAAYDLILKAISLDPNQAPYFSSLGTSLRDLGRLPEAADAFKKAISLNPDNPESHRLLGQTLFLANQLDDAKIAYESAMNLFPADPSFPYNLGVVLSLQGKLQQAIASFRHAIDLKPSFVNAIMNLAVILQREAHFDEALQRYNQAYSLAPDHIDILANRGELLKEIGQLNEAFDDFSTVFNLKPDHPTALDNLILLLHYIPGVTRQQIQSQLNLWNQQFAIPLRNKRPPHHRHPAPDKKLRIGFVSADFRNHPVGRFILPLLKNFDRQQLEIVCYCDGWMKDSLNNLCRQTADAWRDISGLSHTQTARAIRDDQIDILMDLGNHSSGNRLRAFAEKPAPIQASWLAYCSSTGLETMDYRLADPYLESADRSPGEPEQIYRLPKTYWCYAEPSDSPQPANPPSLQSRHVTFGCLNNFCKINRSVLEVWAKILHKIPDSRIILFVPNGQTQNRLFAEFENLGVSSHRVTPLSRSSISTYFNQYQRIDVALDPFPYNGGTTTCDALWMGVPVVSLVGQLAVSRAGYSILSNAGFGQWACENVDRYVKTAVELALDQDQRVRLRKSIRQSLISSPLMNIDAFTLDMMAAFRAFWLTWICSRGGE